MSGEKHMSEDLKPVTSFDLNKYIGKWFEIARLPAWFEKDMTQVTATYRLKKNGTVGWGYKFFYWPLCHLMLNLH